MNSRQKEVQQTFLDNEKEVLKQIKANYADALDEIENRIAILQARGDADLQHVIYQIEYQKALKDQVQTILNQLNEKNFESVSAYLTKAYEDGFIGTMYDLQGQGIPLVFPIDQKQVVEALQHETKLSENLYSALGKDTKVLSRQISGEISRGISNAAMYSEMARNIASYAGISKNNAMRIARTEAHRIQCKATADAQWKAKEKGADVVKQWDASLDGKTRDTHRKLDGQIRELDEPFEVDGMKAMEPGGFGRPEEDINCRCALLQRARWALGNDYTKWDPKEPELISDEGTTQLVKVEANGYESFKEQYKEASERVRSNVQKMNENAEQRLIDKGVQVNIEDAGKYHEEAMQCLDHLDKLTNEYNSTVVSYSVGKTSGVTTEFGSAYMLNGKTSILVDQRAYRINKATDALKLGDNQPLGITYHEFAHSLSQSREKTDPEFWKEIRKIKREYEGMRGESNWFDLKISDYASKDIDEFLAEAFTQAKLSDNPSPYSKEVLGVVDKYFGKTLEKSGESSRIKSITVDNLKEAIGESTIKPEVAEYVSSVLENKNAMEMFDRVRTIEVNESIVMNTNVEKVGTFGDIVLELNANALGGKTIEEIDSMFMSAGNTVANSFEDAIAHEKYHADLIFGKNYSQIESLYDQLESVHIDSLSITAYKDGTECIAEVGVMIDRGDSDKVPKDAMDLFMKYMRNKQ